MTAPGVTPRALTLEHLVSGLGAGPASVKALSKSVPVPISGAVIDSRQATEGCLFIALRGEHSHGHDFVGDAIANGAVAVVTDRVPPVDLCANVIQVDEDSSIEPFAEAPFCLVVRDSFAALHQAGAYWRRQFPIRVIGITGSVGKTTCKEVCAAVLRQRFCTLKTEGNYNNEIGLPLTLLHLTAEHQRAVLEMGMYDLGEIAELAEMALPQVGVVTNIGPTHLERLGTLERIVEAKAELLQALPPAAEGGVAILNADDPRVLDMGSQTQARVFTYGLDRAADLSADDIDSQGLEGIHLRFHHGQQSIYAQLPMVGHHSVHTALCAAAVGLVEGLSWSEIVAGLKDQSAQLRLMAVPGPRGSTILDDTYNASPASSIAALNLLAELPGRKVAVLGDMYELGHYEGEGHRMVGRRARDIADVLLAVGQLAELIGREALEAGMAARSVYFVDTNAQAIELLETLAQERDVILVKGSRGMEMEEIVAALGQAEPPEHQEAV